MDSFDNSLSPVITINIADVCISAVLDNGFYNIDEKSSDIHSHAYYEFLVPIKGEIQVEILGMKNLSLPYGSVCFIPPGVYHRTSIPTQDSEKLAMRFRFEPSKSDNSHLPIYKTILNILDISKKCKSVLVLDNCEDICDVIIKAKSELNKSDLGSDIYAELLISQFYIEIIRRMAKNHSADCMSKLTKTINDRYERYPEIENFFCNNYNKDLKISDLAREMNLSVRQLSRIIKNIYGMCFRDILITTRLSHAAYLLKETDITVEQIAYAVGYTSLSGFYSAFNSKYNITAAQYRAKFRP